MAFFGLQVAFFGLQVAFFGVGLACLISMAYAIRLPAMFELACQSFGYVFAGTLYAFLTTMFI